MSKNGGMGSKRIGSMTSKGMGKCEPNSRAEQCGNARGLGKGRNEHMDLGKGKDVYKSDIINFGQDHLVLLQKQLTSLEVELNNIKGKLKKLNSD